MTQTVGQLEELLEHATLRSWQNLVKRSKNTFPQLMSSAKFVPDKSRDTQLSDNWREGGYPYKYRLSRKITKPKNTSYKLNC